MILTPLDVGRRFLLIHESYRWAVSNSTHHEDTPRHMDTTSKATCPQCGEPISPSWRICPVCETRLAPLTCPRCGGEVRENWRRCPACEAQLACRQCGARLMPGVDECPRCQPDHPGKCEKKAVIREPVCGLEFVLVPGGNFAMGDTLDQGMENERPVHPVDLEGFYISRSPVTQAQWSALTAENPSAFRHVDQPVERVTWTEACEFARKLSRAARAGVRYMLPTEAQWEYAARSGGADDLYAGGDDIDAVAWHQANSRGTAHPVGLKKPNALGLFDMSGNVWEWCRDTYRPDAYRHHPRRNPVLESHGPDRVIRGGSWNLDAWSARCARRYNLRSDFFGPGLGFRLVMVTDKM
jgi:formylglycine-generating enzyme required for sulfatase activity